MGTEVAFQPKVHQVLPEASLPELCCIPSEEFRVSLYDVEKQALEMLNDLSKVV